MLKIKDFIRKILVNKTILVKFATTNSNPMLFVT